MNQTEMNNQKKSIWAYLPITFATALLCCVLWGSASPAIKIAYELFHIPADDTASRITLAGAYTLWGVLLKYNPVSRVSIFGFINPVMGVLLSAIFLGENREAFSIKGLVALLLVALGIIIVNIQYERSST